ncbi:MAG: hypothetical protein FJW20_04365 [Acidimicrobiia bacterium]|nr:hypothetical protein [Acidimicrobiia bacterium]
MTTRRLQVSLGCYAALGAGAALALTGEVRLVVWIFLAGMAVKSWAVWKRERLESASGSHHPEE